MPKKTTTKRAIKKKVPKAPAPKNIESLKHKQAKRRNIPTKEMGMWAMQQRAYSARDAKYLLLKDPACLR